MSEELANTATPATAGGESYTVADQQAQVEYTQVRRAAQWVPLLAPAPSARHAAA